MQQWTLLIGLQHDLVHAQDDPLPTIPRQLSHLRQPDGRQSVSVIQWLPHLFGAVCSPFPDTVPTPRGWRKMSPLMILDSLELPRLVITSGLPCVSSSDVFRCHLRRLLLNFGRPLISALPCVSAASDFGRLHFARDHTWRPVQPNTQSSWFLTRSSATSLDIPSAHQS